MAEWISGQELGRRLGAYPEGGRAADWWPSWPGEKFREPGAMTELAGIIAAHFLPQPHEWILCVGYPASDPADQSAVAEFEGVTVYVRQLNAIGSFKFDLGGRILPWPT